MVICLSLALVTIKCDAQLRSVLVVAQGSILSFAHHASFEAESHPCVLGVQQPLTAAEVTWLLLHFRASLSCMTAQVW
jgi:hypothetical protein